MDNFAGAAIVLNDVFENLAHFLEIGRIGGQEALRRLRVAENSRERLV